IGGARGQAGQLFVQDRKGNFILSKQTVFDADSMAEDTQAVFFDANGDGKEDLLVVSGGQELQGNVDELKPRLYLHDGSGNFKKVLNAFPDIYLHASCAKTNDFDGDGDVDVFIGGRVVAGEYGISPPSFLLKNDGKGIFSNASSQLPDSSLGMVSDAWWQDLDNDGKSDLIVVGEWMPITVLLQQQDGKFIDKTNEFGFGKTSGWWNTIQAADLDADGDLDFLAGNAGLNFRLRASDQEPVELWVGDIDANGSTDPIITYFNDHQRYPFVSRDQLVKQVPPLKRKFLQYADYKNVKLEDILSPEKLKESVHRKAETFASLWIENKGNGSYQVHELPIEAQLFPIFSMAVYDVNQDGHADILAVGNWFAVQPDIGRLDAGYGLLLLGDGKGNFLPQSVEESGFLVAGESRDVKVLNSGKGEKLIVVSRNNDSVLIFKRNR
ncbi:MAG: hypothetical protein RI909_2171, partial [Bacteroidota bacterium]